MRKTILLLSLMTTIFLSCQKEIKNEEDVTAKVNSWLDSKKNTVNGVKNARVEAIRTNLDFSKLSIEDLSTGEKFIIVPIKVGFVANTNKTKNPINHLLLQVDKNGSVIKGNLVQYIPRNRQENNAIPENTFTNIFEEKKISVDGQFVFLSVFDKFLYEKSYKNGSLDVLKEMSSKSKAPQNGRTETELCIDWYLITTIYYSNGTYETTEEYQYTQCYSGCTPNEVCDELESPGGGGGGEVEEERICQGDLTMPVYWIDQTYGGGVCKTRQILHAKFHKIRIQNDRITNCWYVSSNVYENTLGATSVISTYTVSNLGTNNINVAVTGQIRYPNNSYIPFSLTYAIQSGFVAWNCNN